MILLTDELRAQLLANGRQRDTDHVPVVKFFNPLGEGVWLATELDDDGDTLYGLADIGEPELAISRCRRWSRCACLSDSASSATFSFPATFRFRSGPRLHGKPAASAAPNGSSMPRRVPGERACDAFPSPAQVRTRWNMRPRAARQLHHPRLLGDGWEFKLPQLQARASEAAAKGGRLRNDLGRRSRPLARPGG